MPLTNLMSLTDMVAEVSRRIGNQDDIDGVGEAIERAINDAYLHCVLKYKHTEFEAEEPYFFDAITFAGTDAVATASTPTFTTSDANWFTYGEQLIDAVLFFDAGEGGCFTVTGITNNSGDSARSTAFKAGADPPYTISVGPYLSAAHNAGAANQDYTVVSRRYELPFTQDDIIDPPPAGAPSTAKRMFYIINLSDVTNNVPIRSVDHRMFDRSVPLVGQTTHYDRIGNELYLHPAPLFTTAANTDGITTFRLRFALRPEYKTGSDTLSPLPEEWQDVVMLLAQAKLLDWENEHERATSCRQAAYDLGDNMMKPWVEEIEDVETAFYPIMHGW